MTAIITVASTGSTTYPFLQDAIAVANPLGDTINITAGVVPVDPTRVITTAGKNNLTILGNNANLDARNPRSPESIITFTCSGTSCPNINLACSGDGFQIASNNVTINGFTIQDDVCGSGIKTLNTTTGSIITNNIIENNSNGITFNSLSVSISQNLISQNLIRNNNQGSGFGIVSDNLNNALIANNRFVGNNSGSILLFADTGITNITISSNELINGGIDMNNNVSGVTIDNNIINLANFHGIGIFGGPSNIVISNNCILSNNFGGILISSDSVPSSNITISPGNSILCNGGGSPLIGLEINSGSYAGGPGSLDATENYFGPNLGQPPDNIIVDPDEYLNLSGTLTTPARLCPTTPCDIIPPPPLSCTIECSPNIIVNANGPTGGRVVTFPSPTITGTDCGTVTCNPASGSFFPIGTTTVTCSSSALSTVNCSFTVTVNTAPVERKVKNVDSGIVLTEFTNNPEGTIVTYPSYIVTAAITATGFGGERLVFDPPSGSFFPLGLTLVVVRDNDGNTFSFFVNVVLLCSKKKSVTKCEKKKLVTKCEKKNQK